MHPKRILFSAYATTLLMSLTACTIFRPKTQTLVKDLAFERNAKNFALIFGAPNDLQGVAVDVRGLNEIFSDKEHDLGFTPIAFGHATKDEILGATTKYAQEVGENGTLFWYFSGHGAEGSGDLYTQDHRFLDAEEIAEALGQGRSTPIKRFLMFIDSCFSGEFVDGDQPIALTDMAPAMPTREQVARSQSDRFGAVMRAAYAGHSSYGPKLHEELLIMSAASSSQESADLGTWGGGAFTLTLRKTLEKLSQEPESATIQDLVQTTQQETERRYGHEPQFRAEPPSILQEKLFEPDGPATGGEQTSSSQSDLAFALLSESGSDRYTVAIGAKSGTGHVAICLGDLPSCQSSPRRDLAFKAYGSSGDRVVFASEAPLQMTDGMKVTLLAFDGQGAVVSARGVEVHKKRP